MSKNWNSFYKACYASWYAHCPGLKVVSPWSAADAKGLLKAAIRDPNPVIFLENEVMYGQSFDVPTDDDWVVPIGRANVLREGSDVTITAFSIMVGRALEAADRAVGAHRANLPLSCVEAAVSEHATRCTTAVTRVRCGVSCECDISEFWRIWCGTAGCAN